MRWRSIAVGALTLIALQVFLSGKGPEAGGAILGWVATGLKKAMSPDVAAIPYVAKRNTPAAPAKPGTAKDGPIGLPQNPSVGGPTVVTV